MREVTYFYTDDCGLDLIMKKVRDPEKGILRAISGNLMRRYGMRNGS